MLGCRPKRCRRSRPRTTSRKPRFCPEGDGYRLRWFTPSVEVDLCGHATLASAFVVFRYLAPARGRVTFQTEKAGTLTVGRDGEALVLDFPARPPLPCPMSDDVAAALGKRPAALLASRDYLAVFDREDEIAALSPDFAALAALDRFAVIVTAPGSRRRRFRVALFRSGPRGRGGSGHRLGALHADPVLGRTARQDPAEARQLSRRGGRLSCGLEGDRVTIAGRAVLYLEGTITI